MRKVHIIDDGVAIIEEDKMMDEDFFDYIRVRLMKLNNEIQKRILTGECDVNEANNIKNQLGEVMSGKRETLNGNVGDMKFKLKINWYKQKFYLDKQIPSRRSIRLIDEKDGGVTSRRTYHDRKWMEQFS